MRKLFTVALLLTLTAALAAGPAGAATHNFKLTREGSINGTTLEPGKYKLEVNGDEAMIYAKGELVVKCRVEVNERMGGQKAGSVVRTADGTIREIRFDDVVVVFRS